MTTTAVKEWNNDDFLAYTLLFSAKADFVFAREERNLILTKVNESTYNSIRKELAFDNDYQSLQKILEYANTNCSEEDVNALLNEVENLFTCDGNFDRLEKNMLMNLKKLLKKQQNVAFLN